MTQLEDPGYLPVSSPSGTTDEVQSATASIAGISYSRPLISLPTLKSPESWGRQPGPTPDPGAAPAVQRIQSVCSPCLAQSFSRKSHKGAIHSSPFFMSDLGASPCGPTSQAVLFPENHGHQTCKTFSSIPPLIYADLTIAHPSRVGERLHERSRS